MIKYLIIAVIILAAIAGAYLTGIKGYKIAIQSSAVPTVSIQPPKIVPSPTTEIAVISPTRSTPTGNQNNPSRQEQCTLSAGAKSNLFSSENHRLCFLTAKQGAASMPPVAILTKESGNKILVYPQSMQPDSGQFVEVFTKNSQDTLQQAIQKRFLAGINESDCFVRISPNGQLTNNFVKATIGYPVPEGSNEPNFVYGEKCPENYRESNGIAYFLMDKNHPDRFFYFSIGQYSIESETGNQNKPWQDTFQVF